MSTNFEFITNYKKKRQERKKRQQDRLYYAPQRVLIWHSFKKHKIAVISLYLLLLLYILSTCSNFFAPYNPLERLKNFNDLNPTSIHIFSEDGTLHRPFVYNMKRVLDMESFKYKYTEDKTKMDCITIRVGMIDPYGVVRNQLNYNALCAGEKK